MKKKLLALFMVMGIMATQLNVQASTTYMEKEDNDSSSTANFYEVGDSRIHLLGIVSHDDDDDWFKFQATFTGPMKVRFRHKGSSDIDIDFYIKDEDKNVIERFYDSKYDDKSYYIDVRKNEYIYVQVDHDKGYLLEPYIISVDMVD